LDKSNVTLQSDLDKKIVETQPIIEGFDGLMARINALNKLPYAFFYHALFCYRNIANYSKIIIPKENMILN
jgi:hypothetical protein